MTIELEDLGNGSAKSARFPVKYRGARRENMLREEFATGAEFGGAEFGGAEFGGAEFGGAASAEPTGLELVGATEPADPAARVEPAAAPAGRPDRLTIPAEALVEHPLLRGLLLELPPRGSAPDTEWLDCWFEAARSILELLYVQETARTR